MRKFICFGLLLAALLCTHGRAEVTLQLETASVSPGQTVVFRAAGTDADVMYDIYRDGELLVRSEFTDQKTGAYIPKSSGSYRIRVTERGTGAAAEQLFQVTGPLTVSMDASDTSVSVGTPVLYTASAQGGAQPCTYTFSVLVGNTRIDGQEGTDPSFTWQPDEEGQYTVQCTAADSQNASVSVSSVLHAAAPGQELSVTADSTGPFPLYGGMRIYTVHSSSLWTVTCDSDLVTLSRDCGRDGESVLVTVAPGNLSPARAELVFTCGDITHTETVRRLTGDGIEREVHFSPVDQMITVDGASLAVWEDASGSREFSVISQSPWSGASSADWIRIGTTADGNLSVSVDAPTAGARAGYVCLSNGESGAYLSIFQGPAAAGPSIERVLLSEADENGEAVTAEVCTDPDCDRIWVYSASGQTPLATASIADQTSPGVFLIRLSSVRTGSLLFAAEKDGVLGPWKVEEWATTASVIDPAFACDAAEAFLAEEDTVSVKVRVTQSVRNIRLVNAQLVTTGNLSISAAAHVDRYIDPDNRGQYADWTFTVSYHTMPAFLQIGETRIPVRFTPPAEQLPKYDQFDGSWKTVKYRHSDLQTSGCAIFALANALSRLGITGEGTSPAELADTYSFCLVEGGTLNSTLIGNAAKNFGFRTRYDLYEDLDQVLGFFSQGAVFSFSVVKGHIALTDSVTPDGTMFHVVDSALSATFSRIEDTVVYVRDASGSFSAVSSPAEVPGAVYYVETNAWSGGEYYLPADYVLERGVRLILKK